MKYIFTIIAILIVGALVWYALLDSNGTPQDQQNGVGDDVSNRNGGQVIDTPEGYRVVSNNDVQVQFLVPEDAQVSSPQEDILSVKFLGPNNEAGTEIQDGFLLSITRNEDIKSSMSLVAYAQARVDEVESRGLAISEGLEQATVSGESAYRFSHETQLGTESTELLLLPEAGVGYQLTYNISGDTNNTYLTMVDVMVDSMVFLNGNNNAGVTTLSLAMLDYRDEGQESSGPERGCDRVVFIEREVSETITPLNASLETLFAIDDETVGGWHNFIAQTNDTLSFDRAEIIGSTANVYLEGELSGLAGVCDNPRARIQIEETALQFGTVDDVQLYLNGEETDLQPDGRGA